MINNCQTSCEDLPSFGLLHTSKQGLFLLTESSACTACAVCSVLYTFPFSPDGQQILKPIPPKSQCSYIVDVTLSFWILWYVLQEDIGCLLGKPEVKWQPTWSTFLPPQTSQCPIHSIKQCLGKHRSQTERQRTSVVLLPALPLARPYE